MNINPPTSYQAEDRGPEILGIVIFFFVLALIAVLLRFVSRRVSAVNFWWDDWILLLATTVLCADFAFLVKGIQNGAGKHVQDVYPPGDIQQYLMYSYGSEITYCLVITGIKSSILCMYLRLFSVNKAFARAVYAFLVVVVGWGIATLLSTIFQCTPISAAWDPSITNGHCLVYPSWFIGTSIPSILIDFGILILPIPMIWRLKLSTEKKAGLTSIFLLGAFASIISIVRFYANFDAPHTTDVTWNTANAIIWSTIEVSISILCASLPVMAPLARLVFRRGCITTKPFQFDSRIDLPVVSIK